MGLAYKESKNPWEPWFAWYPKQVNGKWYWRQWIYRRLLNTYVDHDDWKRWEYGDDFDYMRWHP